MQHVALPAVPDPQPTDVSCPASQPSDSSDSVHLPGAAAGLASTVGVATVKKPPVNLLSGSAAGAGAGEGAASSAGAGAAGASGVGQTSVAESFIFLRAAVERQRSGQTDFMAGGG